MIKGQDFINNAKQYYSQREIKVKDIREREYNILIDSHFEHTKIISLFKEFYTRCTFCVDNNLPCNYDLIISALLMSNFTNIDFRKGDKTEFIDQFVYELNIIESLINLGLVEKIFAYFDEHEIKKLNDTLIEFTSEIKKVNPKEIDETVRGLMKELYKETTVTQSYIDETMFQEEAENQKVTDLSGIELQSVEDSETIIES